MAALGGAEGVHRGVERVEPPAERRGAAEASSGRGKIRDSPSESSASRTWCRISSPASIAPFRPGARRWPRAHKLPPQLSGGTQWWNRSSNAVSCRARRPVAAVVAGIGLLVAGERGARRHRGSRFVRARLEVVFVRLASEGELVAEEQQPSGTNGARRSKEPRPALIAAH